MLQNMHSNEATAGTQLEVMNETVANVVANTRKTARKTNLVIIRIFSFCCRESGV